MLVVKEKEVSKLTEQLQAVQEEGQKDSAALEAAEQHFKAVSAGLSTNEDGEEATLAGQMMTCKNDMSKADTEAKQVRKGFQYRNVCSVARIYIVGLLFRCMREYSISFLSIFKDR